MSWFKKEQTDDERLEWLKKKIEFTTVYAFTKKKLSVRDLDLLYTKGYYLVTIVPVGFRGREYYFIKMGEQQ